MLLVPPRVRPPGCTEEVVYSTQLRNGMTVVVANPFGYWRAVLTSGVFGGRHNGKMVPQVQTLASTFHSYEAEFDPASHFSPWRLVLPIFGVNSPNYRGLRQGFGKLYLL